MKAKHLLPILPIVTLLAGCGQTELQINQGEAGKIVGTQLTATPLELVVYPDDRPSIPDGAPTYAQNCASCHSGGGGGAPAATGAAGTSQTANAAGGGKSSVNFDATWAHSTKPLDIYRLIAFGGSSPDASKNTHPKFSGKLSARELWNVVVYTRSLGQPALTDKEIAEVDPVFGSNCAVCHGTKGDGDGPLARNLEPMPANFQKFDRFFNRSDDVLFDHIANGIRWEGMPNFLGKKDAKKKVNFDEAYIRKLVQYVHKFHVNNAPVLTANAAGVTAPGAAPNAAAGAAGNSAGSAAATSAGNAAGKQVAKPAPNAAQKR